MNNQDPLPVFRSGNDSADITTLLDYAYYVVGVWEASGEHVNLKKAWLERARELGEPRFDSADTFLAELERTTKS